MSDFYFVQKIMFTQLMALAGSTSSHTFYTGTIPCISFSGINIKVIGSLQFFDGIILLLFLHDAFHFRVRKIIPKLVLHKILNVYPRNNLMNKGL